MRIWIDFINSPQVCFFEPLIEDLTRQGHRFILTCRDSANTVNLVRQRNWEHVIIGNGAKRSFAHKLLGFPLRIRALYSYLRDQRIDAAIGQSSFYLPLTARLLGIPSIYTNDNEHALGNIPACMFATKIFIPEHLSPSQVSKFKGIQRRIRQYPGIKEAVYLWQKGFRIAEKRTASPRHRIYFRPEPRTAQYYSGKINFLDDILCDLREKYELTVLVREEEQRVHYRSDRFSGIDIPDVPLSLEEIAEDCLLFIGAGGSMTREMAILGVPTISVYQGKLLEVDKYLISKNLLHHQPEPSTASVEHFIGQHHGRSTDEKLMHTGKEAYDLFKSTLLTIQK